MTSDTHECAPHILRARRPSTVVLCIPVFGRLADDDENFIVSKSICNSLAYQADQDGQLGGKYTDRVSQ